MILRYSNVQKCSYKPIWFYVSSNSDLTQFRVIKMESLIIKIGPEIEIELYIKLIKFHPLQCCCNSVKCLQIITILNERMLSPSTSSPLSFIKIRAFKVPLLFHIEKSRQQNFLQILLFSYLLKPIQHSL